MATKAQPLAGLALRLWVTRRERILTQAEAAGELGVSVRRYQSWEWGEVTNPQPRARRRIEAWLNRNNS